MNGRRLVGVELGCDLTEALASRARGTDALGDLGGSNRPSRPLSPTFQFAFRTLMRLVLSLAPGMRVPPCEHW
jgi:hypothetical protein